MTVGRVEKNIRRLAVTADNTCDNQATDGKRCRLDCPTRACSGRRGFSQFFIWSRMIGPARMTSRVAPPRTDARRWGSLGLAPATLITARAMLGRMFLGWARDPDHRQLHCNAEVVGDDAEHERG